MKSLAVYVINTHWPCGCARTALHRTAAPVTVSNTGCVWHSYDLTQLRARYSDAIPALRRPGHCTCAEDLTHFQNYPKISIENYRFCFSLSISSDRKWKWWYRKCFNIMARVEPIIIATTKSRFRTTLNIGTTVCLQSLDPWMEDLWLRWGRGAWATS